MTKRLPMLSVTMALLASCGPKGPDPLVVDPKHYKVEFENDRVRVLHVTIGPHEKTPLHYHPEHVLIALTADRGRETREDGTASEGDNTKGAGAGNALVHAEENLSDTVMERYIVEFKKR